MFKIKTKEPNLTTFYEKHNILEINFYEKLKLITNIKPNKRMKRMVVKGYKRLEKELDLMDVFQRSKH